MERPERPTAYWLIGPPACGKSTWVEKHRELLDAEVISTDDVVEAEAKAQGITYDEAIRAMDYDAIVKKLNTKIVKATLADRNIIFDQTNRDAERRSLFRKFIPSDYETVGVVFDFDRDVLRERIVEREKRTGKHIPWGVLEKMINELVRPDMDEFSYEIHVKQDGTQWVSLGRRKSSRNLGRSKQHGTLN